MASLGSWQVFAGKFCRTSGFLPQNIDAAVAVCEEEHVVVVVPGDLVHLELELLLGLGAMRLGVDEGHHVVFVADSDGLTVRAPADVDVLAYKKRQRQYFNRFKKLFIIWDRWKTSRSFSQL